jgi:hypothetical protein
VAHGVVPTIAAGILLSAAVACHSSTAPTTVQVWNYEASALTNGPVTCSFGAAITFSQTQSSGPFSGTYNDAYLSCSSPNGASSTLATGTVTSGSISGSSIAFQFDNSDLTNSGEVSASTPEFSNNGTVIDNDTQMAGTATLTVNLAGQRYVLTGPWQAFIQ